MALMPQPLIRQVIKVYGEGEWKVKKHGTDSWRRVWRKLHIAFDTSTHVQINPQYSSLDFGGSVGTINQLQLDLAFQGPLADNRKLWGKATYTEFFDDAEQSFGHKRQGTELKFTYSYYF